MYEPLWPQIISRALGISRFFVSRYLGLLCFCDIYDHNKMTVDTGAVQVHIVGGVQEGTCGS